MQYLGSEHGRFSEQKFCGDGRDGKDEGETIQL